MKVINSMDSSDYDYIEYIDEECSGADFERLAWKQLIEDAKKKRIRIVLISDFRRMGLDTLEVGDYLEHIFPLLGLRLISIKNHYDSKSGSFSEKSEKEPHFLRKKETIEKREHSVREQWKAGKDTGGRPPFGYKKDTKNGDWKLDEEAAAYVRKIFDWAIEGYNSVQITYFLNELHIPTPSEYNKRTGKQKMSYNRKVPDSELLWDAGKVRNILSRYEYTGALVKGKRKQVAMHSSQTTKTSEEERILIKGTHEAIVSEQEFEQAKESVRLAKKPTYRRKREFALKGKLHCGTCRLALAYVENGNQAYLYCPHKAAAKSHAACSSETYPLSLLEEKILEEWKFQKPEVRDEEKDMQKEITKDIAFAMVDSIYVYNREKIEVNFSFAPACFLRKSMLQ
ncbi:MAG: recombinase family protein [bacterium]|nr:recombinase family protein [bacterium]